MLVKTNILQVKTKCSNRLIKPLHIAPTAHQLHDAQRWVRASNVFILNHLLPRNFAELVAKLPDVHAHLFSRYTGSAMWPHTWLYFFESEENEGLANFLWQNECLMNDAQVCIVLCVVSLMIIAVHRYTLEIPEPVPSWFWHGAQIGGLQIFPVIKISVVHQVRICHLHLLRS